MKKTAAALGWVLLWATFALLVLLPGWALLQAAGQPADLNAIILPLASSVAFAFLCTIVALILGTLAATAVRFLPAKLWPLTDLLAASGVAFPPFIHAEAYQWLGDIFFSRSQLWHSNVVIMIAGACYVSAYLPLTYFAMRISLAKVSPSVVDNLRAVGISDLAICYHCAAKPALACLPPAALLTFVLTISDPLVPALLPLPIPNAAYSIWLAVGSGVSLHQAALLALILAAISICLAIGVGLFYYAKGLVFLRQALLSESLPARPITLIHSKAAKVFTALALVILVGNSLASVLIGGGASPAGGLDVRAIATTVGLAAVGLAVAGFIALLAFFLGRRRRPVRVLDFLFLILLGTPGATLGTALSLAYMSSTPLFSAVAGIDSDWFVTVMAYVTSLSPFLYFAIRAFAASIDRTSIDLLRVMGYSRTRAFTISYLPQLRTLAFLAVVISLAMAATASAPLMWVTSPDVPLVVPLLFRLLDHGRVADAFILTFAMAILLFLLAAALYPLLRYRSVRRLP